MWMELPVVLIFSMPGQADGLLLKQYPVQSLIFLLDYPGSFLFEMDIIHHNKNDENSGFVKIILSSIESSLYGLNPYLSGLLTKINNNKKPMFYPDSIP